MSQGNGVSVIAVSPDGSETYPIYSAAAADTAIRFNISDFRRAIKLWHKDFAAIPPVFDLYQQVPPGTSIATALRTGFDDAKYFDIEKGEYSSIATPASPIGEYWLGFVAKTPTGGTLDFEYSFYHPVFSQSTLVQMQPSYYPLFELWIALMALAKFPKEIERIQHVLMLMGMQYIPGRRMAFSQTDAFDRLYSSLIGSRKPVTSPSE